MNWFGLFTIGLILVCITWVLAYEWGQENAQRDFTMSREWIARQEMERNNWKSAEAQAFLRSKHNHPTNKDWN